MKMVKGKKILLVGNPNIGKSVVFTRLTGANVIASNYAGTTVEYTKGVLKHGEKRYNILDLPGIYSLTSTNKAESVAVEMLDEGDIIINVIDSTNLERNLPLTLELLKKKIPIVIVLNMWDEAKHKGIIIDSEKLSAILGVPVISTVAVSGEGIKKLVDNIPKASISKFEYHSENKWAKIGDIISEVQILKHRHHTFFDILDEYSLKPFTGLIAAIIIMSISFMFIRYIGENIIVLMSYLFDMLWQPVVMKLSGLIGSGNIIHTILIGNLIEGTIDFELSFGLLTTGLYIPLAAVLPYVISFYLVLSFLEDFGYLPRFGILIDKFMHYFGLHGLSIIPTLLGFGCNVPGALATRIMDTRRERFISATLMAIAVPCIAQLAVIVSLVGQYGISGLFTVFLTLFLVWVSVGIFLNKFYGGESPEILIEIPPYRLPHFKTLIIKVFIRVRVFVTEAIPFVLLGVLIVNILYSIGMMKFIAKLFEPVFERLFHLPGETSLALIIGFLRKDVAVGMLSTLSLTKNQAVVASVMLAMYFPCIATFIVLLREFGIKDMFKASLIMIASTVIVSIILSNVLKLI